MVDRAATARRRRAVRRRSARPRGLPAAGDLGRRPDGAARRPLPLRPGAGRDGRLAAGRRLAPAALRDPRRHAARTRWRGRLQLRRVGTERTARQRGRRLQCLGRPAPSDAAAPRMRRVGDLPARRGRRRALQVRTAVARRPVAAAEGRPLCAPGRAAPGHGQRGRAVAAIAAGFAAAPARQRAGRADEHLRGAPGLVATQGRGRQPLARLGRTGRRNWCPMPPGWASPTWS